MGLPCQPFKIEKEWIHNGLMCAVTQPIEGGYRCGYVRLPPSHVQYNKDIDEIHVSVHGGLTLGEIETCTEYKDGLGYWIGFDCCHFGDSIFDPSVRSEDMITKDGKDNMKAREVMTSMRKMHYWTYDEVIEEVEHLADQL